MPVVHKAIRALRAQQLAGVALRNVPIRRRLDGRGWRYRVRSLESLVVADEIFTRDVYREAFDGRDVQSVVDLGANVGYFTLYAAHHTGRRDLLALAVEANPDCVSEARWHVGENRLESTTVLAGAAGFPSDVKTATFWLSASNVASSAQPVANPNVPEKGASREVTVPAIDVARQWRSVAKGRRIDLLKIDVEGFECDLIRHSRDLLDMTDRIVIEWHKWVTSGDEIDELLAASCFARRGVICEDVHAGVAIYDRAPA